MHQSPEPKITELQRITRYFLSAVDIVLASNHLTHEKKREGEALYITPPRRGLHLCKSIKNQGEGRRGREEYRGLRWREHVQPSAMANVPFAYTVSSRTCIRMSLVPLLAAAVREALKRAVQQQCSPRNRGATAPAYGTQSRGTAVPGDQRDAMRSPRHMSRRRKRPGALATATDFLTELVQRRF